MVDLQLPPTGSSPAWDQLIRWSLRRWTAAAVAAVVVALLIGLPTDVIPNPVFGRPVPVTWWSYPTLAITAILGGLLAATYVRDTSAPTARDRRHRCTDTQRRHRRTAVVLRRRLSGVQQARDRGARRNGRQAVVRTRPATPRRRLHRVARLGTALPAAVERRLPNLTLRRQRRRTRRAPDRHRDAWRCRPRPPDGCVRRRERAVRRWPTAPFRPRTCR